MDNIKTTARVNKIRHLSGEKNLIYFTGLGFIRLTSNTYTPVLKARKI